MEAIFCDINHLDYNVLLPPIKLQLVNLNSVLECFIVSFQIKYMKFELGFKKLMMKSDFLVCILGNFPLRL